jgi:hypothetical protein
MDTVNTVLAGYVEQVKFAAEVQVSERTVARYRNLPDGLPYLPFGGKIYIPIEEAREWLKSRVKRPNQRRVA